MTVSWQGKSIDTLLDEGTAGLRYWIEFVPLYEAAFGEAAFGGNGAPGNVAELLAMYDEQRGMRLEKLEQAGEALKVALSEADRQWDAQQGYARRLPELWQGVAATAALDMLGKQSVLADEDRQHARAAMAVIADMAAALRSAVAAKAFATRELLEGPVGGSKVVRIDGKTPEDVKVVVDVHNAREWIDADQVRALGRIFPALAVPEDKINKSVLGFINSDSRNLLTGAYGDRVRSVTEEWLTKTFRPDFDRKLASYVDVCAEVDRLFKDQYQNLTDALAQVAERAYPCPEVPATPQPGAPVVQDEPEATGSPGPPGAPAATAPASTAPSGVPTPATPATPSAPATPSTPATPSMPTTPESRLPSLDGLAALSQVAREFTSVATGLGQALNSGLSALSGAITSGVDDAIERLMQSGDPNSARADDDIDDGKDETHRPTAEFDLGDKHVQFEMGPDGEVKLLLSEATGEVREFTVELNEHGMPIISVTELEEENAQPAAPEAEDAQPPAPEAEAPEAEAPEVETPEVETPEAETPEAETPEAEEKAPGSAPTPDTDAEQPGLPGATPPSARREEDGEHYPKPMPGQGEPESDAPGDSGAELAEAGPLGAELAEAGPL
ncbi:hypothetical protein IU450_15960 [Nocardia abscessus]|uniref:hypothetical protein n=1 Tax=Nocardia abscessus TaxID=120957 RepID=UPI001892EF82|nr:hypothetical protein [Nocardia abscessus]MBF6337380.1 hypothetical protein [Nocardia abscessus]